MLGLVRLGFRYLASRRRSFIAFTLTLFLAMLFSGVMLNASRFIQDGVARAVYTYYPDMVLVGDFPPGVVEVVEGVRGVGGASCIYVVEAVVGAGEGARPVLLAYGDSVYERGLFAVAYTVRPRGLEVLLTPGDALLLGVRRGDVLTLCSTGGVCVEARVAGYYEPFTSLAVGTVLLGSASLLELFNASCRVLALSVEEGFRPSDVAEEVVAVVERVGGSVGARYTLDKAVEALSKTTAIQGMTVSFTLTLGLAITLLVAIAVSLSIIGFEEELSTIGVLKATGLTSWQVFVVYSVGRVAVILLSSVAAVALSPLLGYYFALFMLDGMGLAAGLVKTLVEPRFYTSLAIQELLVFIPVPTLISLAPGLLAKRVGTIEALNPYTSRAAYRSRRASRLLSWSPWLVLLVRRPGKLLVYTVMLTLIALPVVTLSMLQEGYSARAHYVSKLDFETIVYTSPAYHHILTGVLEGARLLCLNVTRAPVDGYPALVNHVADPEALSMVAPLLEGRYPSGPGEAVVTPTIASLLGLSVGDTIEAGGGRYRVVGIVQYYVENGLAVFVYGPGGGRFLTCYVEGLEPDEARRLLEEHHVPARVVDAEVLKTSIVSGTATALGILALPLVASAATAVCGLALVTAADLTVNRHQVTLLKSIGATSGKLVAWVLRAITPLALVAVPAAILVSKPLAEFTALTLAPSLGYDPPRASPNTLAVAVAVLLAAAPIIYVTAYTIAKRVKARELALTPP